MTTTQTNESIKTQVQELLSKLDTKETNIRKNINERVNKIKYDFIDGIRDNHHEIFTGYSIPYSNAYECIEFYNYFQAHLSTQIREIIERDDIHSVNLDELYDTLDERNDLDRQYRKSRRVISQLETLLN